jgi:AcrR family transcriptional regulator
MQARAKARRDMIIARTEDILARDGIEAITTTAVAREAGIPVGSIYRYFKDRNDIIGLLHQVAYDDVVGTVANALEQMEPGQGFRKTHEQLIRVFWRAARSHPTFRDLTRWANAHNSLWDVTPGPESHLDELVRQTLAVAGVQLPEGREQVMLRTAVTTLSVLIDQALEEDDDAEADALIDEITTLLDRYFE